jgi:hypothetical protein
MILLSAVWKKKGAHVPSMTLPLLDFRKENTARDFDVSLPTRIFQKIEFYLGTNRKALGLS